MEPPAQLNNPFCYEPHPLCVEAVSRICDYLAGSPLEEEVAEGKMLGVLVCLSPEGQLGFLAAYSGQLGGREDWSWFVPAVFDYLQPDGYFKREEAEISAINRQIAELEQSPELASLQERLKQQQEEAEQEIAAYKLMMAEKKRLRDEQRELLLTPTLPLVRESQFQKAELRRLKKRWAERIDETQALIQPMEQRIADLKKERKRRSDDLQRWLFDQFVMLNDRGERRTLTSIFADTPQRVPPSGAGECCAPKLLQYAFLHGLKPLAIAECWQGRSPRMEIRHHGQYYPACRGKCKPILEWMLFSTHHSPLTTHQTPLITHRTPLTLHHSPITKHQSPSFLVIDKPAGLLSVPGKTGEESVESLLRRPYKEVYMVHRLDQDTSGLMVVALTKDAYHNLQSQFLARTIYKKYIALVSPLERVEGGVGLLGKLGMLGVGTIRLPLRPDPLDRPRQVVDFEHGKEAITDYEVLAVEDGWMRVALTPHTGRTHQLRVHCAHAEGLGMPIIGDRLYGKSAQRLCLHAAELSFQHPETGEQLHFYSQPPF